MNLATLVDTNIPIRLRTRELQELFFKEYSRAFPSGHPIPTTPLYESGWDVCVVLHYRQHHNDRVNWSWSMTNYYKESEDYGDPIDYIPTHTIYRRAHDSIQTS